MGNLFKNCRFLTGLLSVLASVFLVGIFVYGATTIGTNISTDGNLTVTGNATTTGNFIIGTSAWTGRPTSTLTVIGSFHTTGIATSSDALWVGAGGTVNNLDMTGGDLYVQDDVEIDGTLDIGGGSVITKLTFGTCNIAATAVTASSTDFVDCTEADGVSVGDNVFVTATSSLPTNYTIKAASSTVADIICLEIMNHGYTEDPADNTGVRTFYWQAIK